MLSWKDDSIRDSEGRSNEMTFFTHGTERNTIDVMILIESNGDNCL
jgi:hypothetical protein